MDEEIYRLGERLKSARVEQGLTIRQAAGAAGVSPATIQKIEAGRLVPSIAVFKKVATALRRRASYFLGDEDGATDIRLIRRGSARLLPTNSLVRMEAIAEPLYQRRMEAYLLTIPPRSKSGRQPGTRGELIFFCKSGTLEFWLRGRQETVHPGDTLHLKANIVHRWENRGPAEAELLVIWCPG